MTRLDRWIVALIVTVGVLLPWATGAGVKLALEAQGKPSLPWSYFLEPGSILLEIPLTLWLASPYLVLAYVARLGFRSGRLPFAPPMSTRERRFPVLFSFSVGAVGTLATFRSIFSEFDPLIFLTPLPVVLPAIGIILGWAVGLGAVRVAAQRRTEGSGPPPPVP